MKYPSKILENTVGAIATLPGIGKKTALRLALHLIEDKNNKAQVISQALSKLSEEICFCNHCHVVSDENVCTICQSSSRKNGILCVVENIRDLMAIEDTATFNGKYHVLGGLISPLNGIGASNLNIDSLINRVEAESIEEIIMAISPTVDGETTLFYISKKLSGKNVIITTIARGVSFGGELEYADEVTLGRSISGRIPYKTGF